MASETSRKVGLVDKEEEFIPVVLLRAIQRQRVLLLTIYLGLRRNFAWHFIVPEITHPIISSDFLYHFSLLVDVANKALIDPVTNLRSIVSISTHNFIKSYTHSDNGYCIKNSLLKIKSIITNSDFTKPPAHNITHKIITSGAPVISQPRGLALDRLVAAEKEFNFLLQQGIFRPFDSQWPSPLHMVKKING